MVRLQQRVDGGDPRLCRVVQQLQEIARANLGTWTAARRRTTLAVVWMRRIYHQRPDRLAGVARSRSSDMPWGRAGVPYDTIMASDLTRKDARRYRALPLRQLLPADGGAAPGVEALKSEGRVLAFVYAPGILSENGYHPERVSQVVSQEIAFDEKEADPPRLHG